MKVLICGKGGSGKSSISSLLAKDLLARGYRVLVVDTDESNYGLSTQLGMEDPKPLMDKVGGKGAILNMQLTAYNAGQPIIVLDESWTIDEIPSECVTKKGNLYLMQIGKVHHFEEGCACPMGGLAKDFVCQLDLAPTDVAIIDTEAGTEHLARGVATGVDVVLMVLDPSYESLRLSEKTCAMAGEASKTVYFILNKINDKHAVKMINQLGKTRVIAQIPFDPAIQENGLSGEELNEKVSGIENITEFVIQCSREKQQD
ncbi:MAG: P-loop NTPase [Candidatus Bathyarchaeota archaeon]|nr:P-loop NTPase [Candidatus Bathyarchaeota archaeon]